MTSPIYTQAQALFHGASLAKLFKTLRQNGYSPFQARALLTDLLEAPDTETAPPLPRGWRIRLLEDDGIAIETATGVLDANHVFTRQHLPGQNDDNPNQDDPILLVPESNDEEARAIAWLATEFKRNPALKRGDAQAYCTKNFGVTVIGFRSRVWRAARVAAELPPRAKPGRPAKPKK